MQKIENEDAHVVEDIAWMSLHTYRTDYIDKETGEKAEVFEVALHDNKYVVSALKGLTRSEMILYRGRLRLAAFQFVTAIECALKL